MDDSFTPFTVLSAKSYALRNCASQMLVSALTGKFEVSGGIMAPYLGVSDPAEFGQQAIGIPTSIRRRTYLDSGERVRHTYLDR